MLMSCLLPPARESVCWTRGYTVSSRGIKNTLVAEGAHARDLGARAIGTWREQVPPALMLPQLSPPRPGDRIMLVDDSNEDWWKVTWQGGQWRDHGRRHTSPHLQLALPRLLSRPRRPPLLQLSALASLRPALGFTLT